MKVFLISIFLSILSFILVYSGKTKMAVLIMIFTIPIFYSPLENSVIHYRLYVGMAGLIIFSIWIALRLKYSNSHIKLVNWKNITPKVTFLYYFLFSGILLGYIYLDSGYTYIGGSADLRFTPTEQIINNSVFILLVILLLKILVNFQFDNAFRSKMAKVFICTIFVHVFSQMLKIVGMQNILFGLLSPVGMFDITEIRNLGLWAGFGQGVYVVLIIALSIIYYYNHKKLSISAIVFSFVYSLLSGTRQTVSFIVLFFFILLIVHIVKFKVNVVKLMFLLLFVCLITLLGYSFFSELVIIRRIVPALSLVEKGEVLEASGRDVQGIPYVLNDLRKDPILGKGSLNLGTTRFGSTNIAGHVVWFNIFQKFGFIGLLYLLLILIIPIVKLFKICIKTNINSVFREGSTLFALMIVVFAQQFWDNFFWFSNTMILYAFIYFWVYSFFNREKLIYRKIVVNDKRRQAYFGHPAISSTT